MKRRPLPEGRPQKWAPWPGSQAMPGGARHPFAGLGLQSMLLVALQRKGVYALCLKATSQMICCCPCNSETLLRLMDSCPGHSSLRHAALDHSAVRARFAGRRQLNAWISRLLASCMLPLHSSAPGGQGSGRYTAGTVHCLLHSNRLQQAVYQVQDAGVTTTSVLPPIAVCWGAVC